MKTEIEQLEAFNLTMSNRATFDQCSRQARSWINRTIAENHQTIHELMASSALTSIPQAGLIEAISENDYGASHSGSGSGSGSTSPIGNFGSFGVHSQGQGQLGRRYPKITR